MHDILKDLIFLSPIILSTQTDENIIKGSDDFCSIFNDNINSEFPQQMLSIKTVIKH